jgi:hypothetical protein
MALFSPENRDKTARHRRIWALYEIAYTAVDFGAAISFIIGSIFFFWESLQTAGTWLFLIGSILFAAKPSIRLAREIKLAAIGDYDDLEKRADG